LLAQTNITPIQLTHIAGCFFSWPTVQIKCYRHISLIIIFIIQVYFRQSIIITLRKIETHLGLQQM